MTYEAQRAYLWAAQEIKRYRYKPGVTLEVLPTVGHALPPVLRVTAEVQDSRAPEGRFSASGPVKVAFQRPLPDWAADYPNQFPRWIMSILREFEDHEMREWLRRDGELVDDPHASDPVRTMSDLPPPGMR